MPSWRCGTRTNWPGGVRMTERSAPAEATRFEIRNVDPALAQQLAELQKDFPQSQLAPCGN